MRKQNRDLCRGPRFLPTAPPKEPVVAGSSRSASRSGGRAETRNIQSESRREIEQLLAAVVAAGNIMQIVDPAQQGLAWIAQVQDHLQFEVLQDLQILRRRRQTVSVNDFLPALKVCASFTSI